jgi:hypothetical protein
MWLQCSIMQQSLLHSRQCGRLQSFVLRSDTKMGQTRCAPYPGAEGLLLTIQEPGVLSEPGLTGCHKL